MENILIDKGGFPLHNENSQKQNKGEKPMTGSKYISKTLSSQQFFLTSFKKFFITKKNGKEADNLLTFYRNLFHSIPDKEISGLFDDIYRLRGKPKGHLKMNIMIDKRRIPLHNKPTSQNYYGGEKKCS